jgi:hypothetical protein
MPVTGRSEGNSDLLRVRKGRICRASGDSAVILAALNIPLLLLCCVLGIVIRSAAGALLPTRRRTTGSVPSDRYPGDKCHVRT